MKKCYGASIKQYSIYCNVKRIDVNVYLLRFFQALKKKKLQSKTIFIRPNAWNS